MSSQTKLIIAALAFLGLTAAALFLFFERRGEETTQDENVELPTLPEIDRDALTELVITRPASEEGGEPETVRLQKQGDTWRVVSPVEADADATAIETALDRLGELEVVGIAASNPENHARLEVSDETAIRLEVKAGDESVLTMLIGAYRGRSTMARMPGEDTVINLRGSIKYAFNRALKDWRNKRVLDEAPETVASVRFENANGTFEFVRGDEGAWAPIEGQEPIERFGSAKVQSLVASIARMRAVDFAASDVTAEAAGFAEPTGSVTLVVRAEGGEERTHLIRLGGDREGGNEHYVRREGDETIYVVSQYLADRMRPAAEAFQDAEPGSASAMVEEPPDFGGLGGLGGPGGPGGGLGGPGGEIPPELMEQIQRQLQAASMM